MVEKATFPSSEVNSNVSGSNNAMQGNIFAQQNNETNINDIDILPSEDTLKGNFRLRGTGKYGNTRKEAIENLVKELMQTSAGKIEIRGSKVFVDNK